MGTNKFEQFSNGAQTTLNGGINSTTTSVIVDSVAQFPSAGNFRIIIDNEIMLVTAISSYTFTVERGDGGSEAASHSDEAVVSLILTKESMKRLLMDYTPFVDDDNLLAPMNSLVSGGSVIDSTDFTWVNQGTSTVSDLSSGGIQLIAQTGTGANLRVLQKAIPQSAPWTVTAAFIPQPNWSGSGTAGHCGIVARDSVSSRLITHACLADGTLRILKYTSPTVFSADLYGAQVWLFGFPHWFRIEDNNTNILFYTSTNGMEFQLVASEARTTFLTNGADQVGFYVNSNDTTAAGNITIVQWVEE